MPITEAFKLAAQRFFDQAEQDQLRASLPPAPPLQPIFTTPQRLHRQSPQPDRLVAVRAAASPLYEAATPLIEALARVPNRMAMQEAAALHRRLVIDIAAFQSVCVDALIRETEIYAASYTLCSAFDEFAGDALPAGDAVKPESSPWMADSLAVRFHGDSLGGANIFRLVGAMVNAVENAIDPLEVIDAVLALGYQGMYRHAPNGRRALGDMRHRLQDLIATCRQKGPAKAQAHWQQRRLVIDNLRAEGR